MMVEGQIHYVLQLCLATPRNTHPADHMDINHVSKRLYIQQNNAKSGETKDMHPTQNTRNEKYLIHWL